MDDQGLREFNAELLYITSKWGLKNISLCATDSDGGFVGITSPESMASTFEAAMNVGRLWQHVRTAVRSILDDFERQP